MRAAALARWHAAAAGVCSLMALASAGRAAAPSVTAAGMCCVPRAPAAATGTPSVAGDLRDARLRAAPRDLALLPRGGGTAGSALRLRGVRARDACKGHGRHACPAWCAPLALPAPPAPPLTRRPRAPMVCRRGC